MAETSDGGTTLGGGTTMSDDVVAVIAGIAARGVPGVLALGPGTGAAPAWHPETSHGTAPGVVAAVGPREAAIELSLVAEHGTDLRAVAARVRREVVSSVLRMTELRVTEVNVTVADVRRPDPRPGGTGPLDPDPTAPHAGSHTGADPAGPPADRPVVLHGEIDVESTELLDALARDALAAGRPVVLDVTGVTFMDSAGAAFVATLVRGLGPGRVTVLHPSEQVRFLLEVTRLSTVVHVTPPGDRRSGPTA